MNLYKVNYDTYIAAPHLSEMERIFEKKYPGMDLKKVEVVSNNLLVSIKGSYSYPSDVENIKTGGQNVSKNS